jgi:prepilin-type N-terminal cleavage/methylation domain-containing protein
LRIKRSDRQAKPVFLLLNEPPHPKEARIHRNGIICIQPWRIICLFLKMRYCRNREGFTLVEIMVTTAIIGLLAGIGLPSLTKARNNAAAQTCRNNLRQMEAAKQQAAMEHLWGDTDGPMSIGNPYYRDTCSGYIKGGMRPQCPTGADCYYNALHEAATCQSGIASHALH